MNITNTKEPFFLYLVDDHVDFTARKLNDLELRRGDDYYTTSVAGASTILLGEVGKRMIDRGENLIVFLSSFHGQIKPSVRLAKAIKSIRPDSLVYLKSTCVVEDEEEGVDYSIFDDKVEKHDLAKFEDILRKFIRIGVPA